MNKITITILVWLIGSILIPIYVTFTKFGEIQFGEFYSGATGVCMLMSSLICAAFLANNEEKLNGK